MTYLLVGLLVALIVGSALAAAVLASRRHGQKRGAPADRGDGDGLPGSETAIFAADPGAPLGDTREHAGDQEDGATLQGEAAGALPRPASGMPSTVGGEGEGRRRDPDGRG